VATPPEIWRPLFTESALFLPNSYFPSDHSNLYPRPMAEPSSGKIESLGLKPLGTSASGDAGASRVGAVFANFGQMYKIEPRVLDMWCDALRSSKREGRRNKRAAALLWLLSFPADAEEGMRRQFGIACGNERRKQNKKKKYSKGKKSKKKGGKKANRTADSNPGYVNGTRFVKLVFTDMLPMVISSPQNRTIPSLIRGFRACVGQLLSLTAQNLFECPNPKLLIKSPKTCLNA
jgi:hypothetical protein